MSDSKRDGCEVVVTGWTKSDGKTLWLEDDGVPMFRIGRYSDIGTNKAIHLIGRIPSSINDAQQPAGAVAVASIVSARRPYGVPAINWLMTTDAKAIRPGTPLYLAPPQTIDIEKLRELVVTWKNRADESSERATLVSSGKAVVFTNCADELAALIGDSKEKGNG